MYVVTLNISDTKTNRLYYSRKGYLTLEKLESYVDQATTAAGFVATIRLPFPWAHLTPIAAVAFPVIYGISAEDIVPLCTTTNKDLQRLLEVVLPALHSVKANLIPELQKQPRKIIPASITSDIMQAATQYDHLRALITKTPDSKFLIPDQWSPWLAQILKYYL